MFFDVKKNIRFNEETLKYAEELIKNNPLDYNSFSDVVRSAVNLIYRIKVKKDLKIKTIGGTKWEY